jgi:hypothetical protein
MMDLRARSAKALCHALVCHELKLSGLEMSSKLVYLTFYVELMDIQMVHSGLFETSPEALIRRLSFTLSNSLVSEN